MQSYDYLQISISILFSTFTALTEMFLTLGSWFPVEKHL